MSAIAFTQFRKHLTESVEAVCDSGEPLTVTRADGRDVVIIPAEKWSSMQETEFLMSTPENVSRIDSAIAELNAGKGRVRKLLTLSSPARRMKTGLSGKSMTRLS